MLGPVEVVRFDTFPGHGGTEDKKVTGLGTEAGGIGGYVGYGSDDNLVTITEVARSTGKFG